MKKLNSRLLIFFIAFLIMLVGCGQASQEEGDTTQVKVVATNSIIADLVQEIGGEYVSVHSIVPIGTDPHEYEPLPEDIQKASDADLVFFNGLNLETGNGWFEKLMVTAKKELNQDYFPVSKEVTPLYLTSAGKTNQEDPHAWLDIQNAILYVNEIAGVLAEKDPDHATDYQQNLTAYSQKLTALDQTAKELFVDIPESKRILVTSEGAFKYFSKAYGLTAAYIWEINTESQGTPDQMKAIIDTVRETNVPVLFVETSVDPRSMERLSKETNLPIFGELFTDSLAKKGTTGDTYLGMMEANLQTIHQGLLE